MSHELVNQSLKVCRTFSRQAWAKALELALLYGWRPIGTQAPPMIDFYQLGAEWDGRYLTNDGQIVITKDAYSLATALERSLDDIPDVNVQIDWSPKFWMQDDYPEWLSPEERELIEETLQEGLLDTMGEPPCEFFAGDAKYHLLDLIRFCRLGSFAIF